MDFKRATKLGRDKRKSNAIVSANDSNLCDVLSKYKVPPVDNISLMEFENFALERLQVLRIVERANFSGHSRHSKEWRDSIQAALNKQKLRSKDYDTMFPKSDSTLRQDHISHYILRLAYCRTDELRRWFITHELDLLHFRDMQNKMKLLLENNYPEYKPISQKEKNAIAICLGYGTAMFAGTPQVASIDFYKVPFTDAIELVRHRKVYLKDGFAYVPEKELVSIVFSRFRSELSRDLLLTARILPSLDEDERLRHFINNFDKSYTGSDYSTPKEGEHHVTPESLDQLSKKSYPICMRQMHEALAANSHLRHQGRMQYGLFLKGIGLSLADALRFWREQFSKKVDGEKFQKDYAYNIRHNYGKEGKQTSYTPHSCVKIIFSNPGPGDYHGCPFKTLDAKQLKLKLQDYRVPSSDINRIVELSTNRQYQIACQHLFNATHGIELDEGLNHPNQYFEKSQKILNGTLKIEKSAAPSSASVASKPVRVYEKQRTVMDELEERNDEFLKSMHSVEF